MFTVKIAIIGSRSLNMDISKYIPKETTQIVSGGAYGIDSCARDYANSNNIKLTEILPEYGKYGRAAPLKRNEQIVDAVNMVIAFWDGISHGTKYTIDYARKKGKKVILVQLKSEEEI